MHKTMEILDCGQYSSFSNFSGAREGRAAMRPASGKAARNAEEEEK